MTNALRISLLCLMDLEAWGLFVLVLDAQPHGALAGTQAVRCNHSIKMSRGDDCMLLTIGS